MWKLIMSGVYTPASGVSIASTPVFTPSKLNRDRSDIYMFDGGMLDKQFYRSSAYVDITFHSTNFDALVNDISKNLVSNVNSRYGCPLNLYDDSATGGEGVNAHYEVLGAEITAITPFRKGYGRVSVKLELYPYKYINNTTITVTNATTFTNNYDLMKPYFACACTSNSSCYIKIDDDGEQFNINNMANATAYVDSKKLSIEDTSGYMIENKASGDYKSLWVPSGQHKIIVNNMTASVILKGGVYI